MTRVVLRDFKLLSSREMRWWWLWMWKYLECVVAQCKRSETKSSCRRCIWCLCIFFLILIWLLNWMRALQKIQFFNNSLFLFQYWLRRNTSLWFLKVDSREKNVEKERMGEEFIWRVKHWWLFLNLCWNKSSFRIYAEISLVMSVFLCLFCLFCDYLFSFLPGEDFLFHSSIFSFTLLLKGCSV